MNSQKTKRIKRKIIEAIEKGSTIMCACAYAGFSSNTLYKWMEKDKVFKLAVEQAGLKQVGLVVGALIKRAMGFEVTETHTEEIILCGKEVKKGEKGKPDKDITVDIPAKRIKKITKHYAGDIGAQIFYLCNRDKLEFKNVQSIVHSGDPDNPVNLLFTDADLYLKKKEEEAKAKAKEEKENKK